MQDALWPGNDSADEILSFDMDMADEPALPAAADADLRVITR